MDIPIGAEIFCGTEVCGRSTYLVINPVNDEITHVVVAEKSFPHIERLVPLANIVETSSTSIRLRCSLKEFDDMEPFMKIDFIAGKEMKGEIPGDAHFLFWPYSSVGMNGSMPMPVGIEYKQIPAGEVVIRRGTQVRATDGNVGKVDEFLVGPRNDRISYLVMREGHLWGAKDVTIPVSEIRQIADEVVYLKINRQAVADLPAVPVHRRWK